MVKAEVLDGEYKMDEEEILDRITHLLEKGGTMLATHHDCGAPLFRFQGQVVCPVCSFSEQGQSSQMAQPDITPKATDSYRADEAAEPPRSSQSRPDESGVSDKARDRQAIGTYPDRRSREHILRQVRDALLARMEGLASEVREEQDYDQLRSQLDCLEAALRALQILDKE